MISMSICMWKDLTKNYRVYSRINSQGQRRRQPVFNTILRRCGHHPRPHHVIRIPYKFLPKWAPSTFSTTSHGPVGVWDDFSDSLQLKATGLVQELKHARLAWGRRQRHFCSRGHHGCCQQASNGLPSEAWVRGKSWRKAGCALAKRGGPSQKLLPEFLPKLGPRYSGEHIGKWGKWE